MEGLGLDSDSDDDEDDKVDSYRLVLGACQNKREQNEDRGANEATTAVA
jgi:hypothetical protein